MSQDLNRDPQFREYAKKFGLGGVRFWLEVLAILDRSDNYWDLIKGFDLGLLAGSCETKRHIIQGSFEYLRDINWLRVGIDLNQKLFVYAPKWMEYNKRREDKGNMMDTRRYQEGTYPTPSPYPSPFLKKEIHKEKSSNSKYSEKDLKGFGEFWEHYPERNGKKLDKPEAQKLFLVLSQEDQILAIRAAQNYAVSEMVVKGYGIKDPKRFLKSASGNEPWRDWTEPERLKTAVKDSSGRESTIRPPAVYCRIHYDKDIECMNRIWPRTESERVELIESCWLCDRHKEFLVGQANEDNISTLKSEEQKK